MTDNEIINDYREEIEKPKYLTVGIFWNVLDLINRQKAEIERLQKECNEGFKKWEILGERTKERYAELYEEAKEVVKSEARKEFAERLKAKEAIHFCKCGEPFVYTDLFNGEIDNLLEEMESESNG